MPARCVQIVVDSPDEAGRPLTGQILVEADRTERANVVIALRVQGVGTLLRLTEDETMHTIADVELVPGVTATRFQLAPQARGWSHEHGRYGCRWQLEARVGEDTPMTLPLQQRALASDLVLSCGEPQLELVATRDFGPVVMHGLAVVALLGIATLFVTVWRVMPVVMTAGMMLLLMLPSFATAISVLRTQGRVGTPQFELVRENGLRATVWLHPRVAVASVELVLVIAWSEEHKPANARASVARRTHVVREVSSAATQHEPGVWTTLLDVPAPSSVPPRLTWTGRGLKDILRASWDLETRMRMRDGSLETVRAPVSVDLRTAG